VLDEDFLVGDHNALDDQPQDALLERKGWLDQLPRFGPKMV
jgi:hypothetical protein